MRSLWQGAFFNTSSGEKVNPASFLTGLFALT